MLWVMEIHVKLTQFDIVRKDIAVLADGAADLNGNTLCYTEKENPSIRHEIRFDENQIVLKRLADISSETCLLPDRKGTARVDSPFGVMELETVLSRWSKDGDRWMVEYQILDDSGDAVTSQQLVWELKGVRE